MVPAAHVQKWWIPLVVAGASLLASGWSAYNHNDKQTSNRLTAVETKQADDRETLKHVSEQVDKIYDKVAKW